jgi:hypothetical protein
MIATVEESAWELPWYPVSENRGNFSTIEKLTIVNVQVASIRAFSARLEGGKRGSDRRGRAVM